MNNWLTNGMVSDNGTIITYPFLKELSSGFAL